MTPDERRPLIAYYVGEGPAMPIVPASRWRDWMNATTFRNANRCLPLLMGNEYGWVLLNQHDTVVEWSGGDAQEDLRISYERFSPHSRPDSVFGYGILTFRIPYVFRTPPGWDLMVRGPTNQIKDGVRALDAIVETDWSVAPFTMNWKLTRPGSVEFAKGEPICMVTPQRRHDVESFDPVVRPVSADEATEAGWRAFLQRREQINIEKFLAWHSQGPTGQSTAWHGDYFRGRLPEGSDAPEHLTKRRLKPFEENEAPDEA